jgi:hypothetical protein
MFWPAAKLGNIRKDYHAEPKVFCESLVARINIVPDGPSVSSFPSGSSRTRTSSRSMQWLFLCRARGKIGKSSVGCEFSGRPFMEWGVRRYRQAEETRDICENGAGTRPAPKHTLL